MIKLFWHRNLDYPNFGDELSPYIIEHLTGKPVKFVSLLGSGNTFLNNIKIIFKGLLKGKFREVFQSIHWLELKQTNVLVSIGSILAFHQYKYTTVWGSGIISSNVFIVDADFKAVRGWYTIKKIQQLGYKPPTVIGDPALLLSMIYKPKLKTKSKIGVIPHVMQYEALSKNVNNKEVEIISLVNNIEDIIDSITNCEFILSTSLHGLIVAHTYGIPAIWIQIKELEHNKINGDNIKFLDYFSSVKLNEYTAVEIEYKDFNNIADLLVEVNKMCLGASLPDMNTIERIKQQLISVAPFKVLDKYKNSIS